jgi:multidrug efflux system outer membrane protein
VVFLGNVALEASTLVGLGSAGGDAYSFGPSISWPAFDLGRVRARIQAADARAESQLARYEQTVLVALEETENALLDFGRQQARRDFLRAAAGASEKAAALARQRFEEGVSDFLTVLDAERRLLEDQDRLAQSETDTAIALVAVYKALGGGWEMASPDAKAASLR